ncbi:hypothetical protein [Paenibacillus sp. HGF5]|uniref:hypothetical protein n=1 Tax=Paenibacillus sp. HGF5 TaxID=908341 RepID=UPI000309228B|nr:hypothetical protein [Paenibacillus sp. HGF5]
MKEQLKGAVADKIVHSHTSLEKCLEVIRQMDGFARSQITIQHIDNIMIGGGRHEFIVTVETRNAIHNLLSSPEEED